MNPFQIVGIQQWRVSGFQIAQIRDWLLFVAFEAGAGILGFRE